MNAARGARLVSVLLVLGSIAVLLTTGLNLGIDFKGGTKIIAAFESGDATAPGRLQRSIALEMVLVVVILLITAVLTRVTSPNG